MTRHVPRIVVTLLAMLSFETFACECDELKIEQAYSNADLVILGTVTEIMSMSQASGSIAIIKPHRHWKQKASKQMVITSPSDCVYNWQRGERHLLFLNKNDHALYSTTRCHGNKAEADASAFLKWLKDNGD